MTHTTPPLDHAAEIASFVPGSYRRGRIRAGAYAAKLARKGGAQTVKAITGTNMFAIVHTEDLLPDRALHYGLVTVEVFVAPPIPDDATATTALRECLGIGSAPKMDTYAKYTGIRTYALTDKGREVVAAIVAHTETPVPAEEIRAYRVGKYKGVGGWVRKLASTPRQARAVQATKDKAIALGLVQVPEWDGADWHLTPKGKALAAALTA